MLPVRLVALSILLLPLAVRAQEVPPVGFGFAYLAGTDGQTVVTGVAPGGAAEAAGLAAGDTLISVSGESVTGPDADVHSVLLAARDAGRLATFKVLRNAVSFALTVGTAPYDPEVLSRLAVMNRCVTVDCLDGVGTWVAPDGERYTGVFVAGRRHGPGRLSLTNGDLYIGNFRDGKIDGHGTYVWANGELYVGDVREGAPHGAGVRAYDDGTVYTGEFVAGVRHGIGTFRRPDGTFWQGSWVDDAGTTGTDYAANGMPLGEASLSE